MAETIKDLMAEAKNRGYNADQFRERFREKYGQEVDDYQDKLDTPLDQLASKKAPAIAPEMPAARELGKELATGTTAKGFGIGGALGAAFGAPTAGAAIGAGIGKLLEPKVEKPEPSTPAERIETGRAGAALGGALFGAPGALAGAALGAKFPMKETAKYDPYRAGSRDFETQLEYLKTTGQIKPKAEKEAAEVEEPLARTTGVAKPASTEPAITQSEAEKLNAWDYAKPPSAEIVNMYRRVKGEDPSTVYDLRHFQSEQSKEHKVGAYAEPEFKWATPTDVVRRVGSIGKGAVSKLLGETELTQTLEEPFAPDPDRPRPPGEPGMLSDSRLAVQQRLWDEMQEDPKMAAKIRRDWERTYAARTARGAPLHGEGLPTVFETSKDEVILPERFRPFVEQMTKERRQRRITAPHQALYNFGLDLTTSLAGLAEMANKVVGAEVVPETPEVVTAKAQLEKAKKSGDKELIEEAENELNDISQKAIGAELGAGLGGLPGQLVGLAGGLTDPSGANIIFTHPFTAFTSSEPAIGGFKILRAKAAKYPALDAKLTAFEKGARNFISEAVDAITPNIAKKLKQKLVQYMADSLEVGDKERTQILDNIIKDQSQLNGLAELLRRDAKAGKVPDLTDQDLVEIELKITPEPSVRAARAAERAAEKAGTRAESMAQAKAMSIETAEKMKVLDRQVRKLKKEADKVQKQIAGAATEADKAQLKQKLEVLRTEQASREAQLAAEARESRLRGKAKIASEEAMETGVGFAEEMKKPESGLPKEARAKARAAEREVTNALAEMERKQSAAEEARQQGLVTEEALQQRGEEAQARLRERERAAAGKAAVAGVEMAEGVKGIEDTEAAAQAARRAASAQAGRVSAAERAAKTAAEAAEKAAGREEISAGRIYVPREKLASAEATLASEVPVIRTIDPRSPEYLPRMLEEAQYRLKKAKDAYEAAAPERREALKPEVLKAFDTVDQVEKAIESGRRGEYRMFEEGGPQRLARLFEEMPKGRRKIIEDLAVEASDYKRKALDAGFDPNAPISAEAASKIGVPEDTTVYAAARRLAEHIDTTHKDPVLVAEFLRKEGVTRGVDDASRWINSEIAVQNAASGMIEPTYGAVRRPTPVVEQFELTPTGEVVPRAKARTEGLSRAVRPMAEGEVAPTPERNALNLALDEMQEYLTKREAPKNIKGDQSRFAKVASEYADAVREMGSFGQEVREPRFDLETPSEPGTNKWANQELEAGRKLLTPERIYQRLFNNIMDDTMQLSLHSPEFRDYLMKLVDQRIKKAGFSNAERKLALTEVNKLITDPRRLSAYSKEKFPVVANKGKAILKADDFIEAAERLDPKIVGQARANAIDAVTNEMNRAAATYGTLHAIESEMNRFRFDKEGNPRVLSNGKQAALQGAEGYAAQLAESVVRNKETLPLILPYEGAKIADTLRLILQDADSEFKWNWTSGERAKLQQLIDDIDSFQSAQTQVKGGTPQKSNLVNAINSINERTFKGTDTKPVDFHNVHMHPAVLKALESHFQDLLASDTLQGVEGAVRGLSKMAQRNVVPLNLSAMVNNNLSNSLMQLSSRGSTDFIPGMIESGIKYKKFLDGDYGDLTPAEVRKFKAINRNAPIGHTEYTNEITKSNWWQQFKREKGLDVTEVGRALRAAPDTYGRLRDMMTDFYSKFGDTPFRLEEMNFVYDNLSNKLDELEVGRSVNVPVSRHREVRITRMTENKYKIEDMSGQQKPQIVGREDQLLADTLGANANVMQNKKFLDPKQLGLWGRALQRGSLPLVSGIFTWYQGAMDIPFIKNGLVNELMFGGPFYETNSPAVRMSQAMEYTGRALKRAMMVNAAQAAFLDQRKLRNLRHALGYNPSLEATVLAEGTNPAYLHYRNLDPLMFTTPTVNTLNSLVSMIEAARFAPIFHEPDFYAKVMNSDLDWAKMSDEQIAAMPKELADYGKEMKELAKNDPEDYADRALVKRDLMRWGNNEISSPSQFFQTMGLAGGPLLNWIMKIGERGWNADTAMRKFGEMVLGATPFRAMDVTAAALGEAGLESIGELSSYGTDLARSGFHAKSEETPDMSTLVEWGINQILGIGWKQLFYGTGKEKADDVRGYSKAKSVMKELKKAIDDSFKKSVERKAKKVLGKNATEEQIQKQVDRNVYYKVFDNGLKRTLKETMMNLQEERNALEESRRKYPAPND